MTIIDKHTTFFTISVNKVNGGEFNNCIYPLNYVF